MRRRKPTRYNLSTEDGSLTATELRRARREIKIDAMRTWFYAHYADPAESTPYESAEGGYIYIWGGPYDPQEELQSEFTGAIPDGLIDELASELSGISWEWTGHPERPDYDEYLFESIARSTEHKKAFEEAIGNVEQLIVVNVKGEQRQHLLRLLYVSVITAMETYLSDVFISTVGNDKTLLRRFVESTPEFKAEKLTLSEVFKAMEEVEKRARSYLVDVVWHHLAKVKQMFKVALDIEFPDGIDALFQAIMIRHDLVHRNGKTKDGEQHKISTDSVKSLITDARKFVEYVDGQLSKRTSSRVVADESSTDTLDF